MGKNLFKSRVNVRHWLNLVGCRESCPTHDPCTRLWGTFETMYWILLCFMASVQLVYLGEPPLRRDFQPATVGELALQTWACRGRVADFTPLHVLYFALLLHVSPSPQFHTFSSPDFMETVVTSLSLAVSLLLA